MYQDKLKDTAFGIWTLLCVTIHWHMDVSEAGNPFE